MSKDHEFYTDKNTGKLVLIDNKEKWIIITGNDDDNICPLSSFDDYILQKNYILFSTSFSDLNEIISAYSHCFDEIWRDDIHEFLGTGSDGGNSETP